MTNNASLESLANTAWPENGLEPVKHCPICNSARRALLHDGLSDRTFFCAPGRWTMYRCSDCQSGYLDPRPSDETLSLAYSKYYTHETEEPAADSEVAKQQFAGTFRQALRNGFQNSYFGTSHAPSSRLGQLAGVLWPRMGRVVKHKNFFITNRPRSVLDVGFGAGDFLNQARKNGWNPVGIDMDSVAVAQARKKGFEAYEGGIEALSGRTERFDAITMSHVIEHVSDPAGMLQAAHSLLNPGGMIYIDTPNLQSGGHAVFGKYWQAVDPPRHLVLFTWTSLETLLADAGFTGIKRHARPSLTKSLWRASTFVKMGVPLGQGNPGQIKVPFSRRVSPYLTLSTQEYLTLTAQRS